MDSPFLHSINFSFKFALKFKDQWEHWKIKLKKYRLHNVSMFHWLQEPQKECVPSRS